jgi:hypothetical protein
LIYFTYYIKIKINSNGLGDSLCWPYQACKGVHPRPDFLFPFPPIFCLNLHKNGWKTIWIQIYFNKASKISQIHVIWPSSVSSFQKIEYQEFTMCLKSPFFIQIFTSYYRLPWLVITGYHERQWKKRIIGQYKIQ